MTIPKIRPRMQKTMPPSSSVWPSTPKKLTRERSGSRRLASPPASCATAPILIDKNKLSKAIHPPLNLSSCQWTHLQGPPGNRERKQYSSPAKRSTADGTTGKPPGERPAGRLDFRGRRTKMRRGERLDLGEADMARNGKRSDGIENGNGRSGLDSMGALTGAGRREFLQGAAATAAALAMPAWARGESNEMGPIRAEIEKRHDEAVKRLQT